MSKLYHNMMRNAPYAFFIIALISFPLGLFSISERSFVFLIAPIWFFAVPYGFAALLYRIDMWLENSK